MEVVALVPGRDHVCTRYRIGQFSQHLADAGLRLTLEPLSNHPGERLRQLTRRRRRQVVVLIKKLLPVWQVMLLRKFSDVLVYDFDDAVFFRDSFHPRGPYSLTRAIRFRATVAMADHIFAGNSYLASAAESVASAERVHVIPTCVNPNPYRPVVHNEKQPIRLVWIGSASTVPSLELARPVLESVGKLLPGTVLRVICNRFPQFQNLRVEAAPWSEATECAQLGESDIGISWVPDDQWSRGKCGLKVLQYMATGLPVVASPVGVHLEMLPNGTGWLPTAADEWVEAIGRLATDAQLRRQMGAEGRERLERQFHVDAWGPVIAERLKEAASR